MEHGTSLSHTSTRWCAKSNIGLGWQRRFSRSCGRCTIGYASASDRTNYHETTGRQRVEDDPASASAYISPYDNPLLWTGHSTVIDEMEEQLQAAADGAGAGAMSTTAAPASVILSMYIPGTYSR
jgi:hypothetical protein